MKSGVSRSFEGDVGWEHIQESKLIIGNSQLCVRLAIARIQLNGLVEVVDALVELGIIKISAASNIGFVSFRICSLSADRVPLICEIQLASHLIRNRLG